MTVSFTAKITPRGKQRARTVRLPNGRSMSYTPKETVEFERAIGWAYRKCVRAAKIAPYEPVELTAWLYMPLPKSASKRLTERLDGDWHTKKPDCSNVVKSVEDALNKLAYEDDGQIAALHVYKVYGKEPRVEVTINKLDSRKEVFE